MELKLYTDQSGFAALHNDWNALLARSRTNTLFLSWEWQTTWWRCLGEGDLWLLAWYDGGRLVAIAPLYLHRDGAGLRRFDLVGCVEVSDYLDLLVEDGREEAVYSALLDWLDSDACPPWDVTGLCNLAETSLTHRLLPELAAGRGWEAVTSLEDVCPLILLPDSFEAYLQENLSKKQRHEVRRKLRRIEEEAAVRWYVVDGASDLGQATDAFLHLHRLSKDEKESFMTPEMEAFFREAIQVMHHAGWLYLAFIEVNGAKAAAMLGFIYDGRLLVYNSGYDPASYSELSPGIVLTARIIEDAIQRGLGVFDFLQGNEVYKYRFGAQDTVVYSTVIRPTHALSGDRNS
ncbi:MAG TPA: GNAT family N-acetyltransferase [Anaerolineae bacterium]|nr:GNAT family N-acetyltransferase [Anaerolineae bacterium]